jgi:hypothetical protein
LETEQRSQNLARQIIVAAFKVVLPGTAERVSGLNDIVVALTDKRASLWSRNTLTRQLESASDQLAEKLASFEPFEFRDLP